MISIGFLLLPRTIFSFVMKRRKMENPMKNMQRKDTIIYWLCVTKFEGVFCQFTSTTKNYSSSSVWSMIILCSFDFSDSLHFDHKIIPFCWHHFGSRLINHNQFLSLFSTLTAGRIWLIPSRILQKDIYSNDYRWQVEWEICINCFYRMYFTLGERFYNFFIQ